MGEHHERDRQDEGGDAPCWAHELEGRSPIGPTGWDQLLHQLSEAVVIADRDGMITYWNVSAERVFGWSAAEATGSSLDLIIPERLRTRHWAGWDQALATGTTRYGADDVLDVPASRKDGNPLSIAFSLTLLRDASGTVTHLVAVIRDDTERWQERRALETELARLRADTATDTNATTEA